MTLGPKTLHAIAITLYLNLEYVCGIFGSASLRLVLKVLALVIAALCFACAGVAEAQGLAVGPAEVGGPTLAAATEFVKEWLAIVGALATTAAVIGGGIFAWRNGQIFRAKAPHVIISHEVSHRLVGTQYVHIFVTAVLHNSSRVHIEFLDGFATVQQVRPVTDDDVERLYEEAFLDGEFAHLQWPLLDVLRHSWNRDGLLVEPGEIETETFDFIVQKDVESVAVRTYFYNGRVVGKVPDDTDLAQVRRRRRRFWRWLTVSGPLGWGRTTVYDIVIPE